VIERSTTLETPGLNHVILTIGDVARSRAFYGDLLGFSIEDMDVPGGGFYFESGPVWFFCLPSRQPVAGDRFSEFRIGLDHLAFTAPSEAALQSLADKLKAAGVETNGVEVFAPTGNRYVAFRDPDNVQLEYWLP
jgi:catechol 2,3-dioxygenase-like lactoylglutathione lyase family enzyme